MVSTSSLRLLAAVPVVFISAKLVSKLLKAVLDPKRTGPPTADLGLHSFIAAIASPSKQTQVLMDLCNMHGPVCRIQTPLFCPQAFVVADWKTIDLIYEGDKKLGIEEADRPAAAYKAMSDYTLGVPNIVSKMTHGEGPEHGWAWARKGLAPAFSRNNLLKQLDALQNEVERMAQGLEASSTDVDLPNFVNKYVMRMLCAAMFLIDLKDTPDRDAASEIVGWSHVATDEILKRLVNPFRSFKFWDASLNAGVKSSENLMKESKCLIEMYSSNRSAEEIKSCPSAIGHLLRSPYPNEKARTAEMSVLLLAGAETTAHTTSWTLWEVFRNPQVLQKVRSELDAINPSRGAWDKDKLSQLDYVGHVINEGMRKWPTVPYGVRQLPHDTPSGEHILPKGSFVSISFFGAARTGVQNAETFDPERWVRVAQAPQSEQETLNRFSGFSKGKRNCLGKELALLELKLIMATVLQRVDLEIVKDPVVYAGGSLKPLDLIVKAKARPL
mmetsp:Transcript_70673/g.147202  ORF Transcript_70673/g.147202 Transcript_70673/m.147202 type:complete len:499 (-) Transcript_70673:185-1681(-)|eukprot:CAMPEP_0181308440 /NCGR_PEP_ID=MMETSP1101-20121128/11464_1 /TAXON_ID=46948 /ORGANISM="Rhodomonas abbreviata, Strain Caron Lab Isolate" /LENGTH=498 /DNA_ID=CAMNT_0023414823 /DNA_START=175 /DNA_END=1671 /DNA_ORIENTATION=+